jgi:hypothetical protein
VVVVVVVLVRRDSCPSRAVRLCKLTYGGCRMSKVIVGIERKVGEVAVESCGRTLSVSCKTEGLMGEAKASVASRRKIVVLICDIVGVV